MKYRIEGYHAKNEWERVPKEYLQTCNDAIAESLAEEYFNDDPSEDCDIHIQLMLNNNIEKYCVEVKLEARFFSVLVGSDCVDRKSK